MAMFGFLKNKIKETVDKFSKKTKEVSMEVSDEELSKEELTSLENEKKEFEDLIKDESKEEIKEELDESTEEESEDEPEDFEESKEETKTEDVDESEDELEELEEDFEEFEEEINQEESKENNATPISNEFHSVDDLLDVKEDKKEIIESSKEEQEDLIESKEESQDSIEDEDSSDEIDPLVEEVIERNKSFEESLQQESPQSKEDIEEVKEDEFLEEDLDEENKTESKEIESIADELKEREIVDDSIQDTDVVEDIIALDTEDVVDNSSKPEEKKGFFKKLFSKKVQEEEELEELEDDFEEEESKLINEPVNLDVSKLESKSDEIKEAKKTVKDSVDDIPIIIKEKETITNSPKEAVHKDLLSDDISDSTKKKKGFFGKLKEKVVKFQLTDDAFEELFWDFELALLEGNVASEVIEKIKSDLKEKLTSQNVSRKDVGDIILETLKSSLDEILSVPTFDIIQKIKSHNSKNSTPCVICIVGVNGSGKTTTIAKIISLFQKNNLSLVVAAADTFRAAAIQQLEEHTNKLGVKLIKHDYNADPAAVAFDAINHAKAKDLDVVLIDTAGRLQSNSNLMDELKKLVRVNKPDLTIFVGESITGNDCVEQAVAFNEAVGIDAIILSKADVDDKGGAAISVSYVTKKPILYLGTGQTYSDLKPFNKDELLETLGL